MYILTKIQTKSPKCFEILILAVEKTASQKELLIIRAIRDQE